MTKKEIGLLLTALENANLTDEIGEVLEQLLYARTVIEPQNPDAFMNTFCKYEIDEEYAAVLNNEELVSDLPVTEADFVEYYN